MRFSSFVRSRSARVLLSLALGAGVLVAAPVAASAAPATPAAVVTAPAGVKTTITPGLKGFDNGGVVSSNSINCLSAGNNYSFAMVNVNETTYTTYNNAAAAGMKIVLFQGYYTWTSAADGKTRGENAAATAGRLGYPRGAMIFLNLEATGSSKVVLAWVQNWIAAVRAGGYLAGIYVGINPGLTKAQLDSLGGVSGYWKSASTSGVPVVARGYVVRQPTPLDIAMCNTKIDNNFAATDNNGAQLIGAAFPKTRTAATQPGTFVPLTPARLLDTRTGVGAPRRAVPGLGHVDLQVTGSLVPAGASAVVLNVTVTAPTSSGNVAVSPTGVAPNVSNVNFVAGQTAANLVTVELNSAGKVTLTLGSKGSAQIIADVAGYYLGGSASAPGTFTPVTPTRLLDTRPGHVAPFSTTLVQVAGKDGIRTDGSAGAAVVNLTSVTPKAVGYLTAFSNADPRPTASNLNYVPGQSVPNLAAVRLNGSGQLSLYNGSKGTTDLLADIAGYYLSGTPAATGAFALTPSNIPPRILDTRSSTATRVPSNSAIALQVTGVAGIPATATAVAINVTVTNPTVAGYLGVFPSDRSAPLASNLNFVKGQTVANLVMVPIGADGKIVLNNQSKGTTDLVGDVAGYFVG